MQDIVLVVKIKAKFPEVRNEFLDLVREEIIQGLAGFYTSQVRQLLTANSQTRVAPSETCK